ncbi:MAG TPA: TRAP transporter small permease [Burkholderiaceae bacterium]|nr:TRAP transporter small permease [Burkholderiaceae bacterium]
MTAASPATRVDRAIGAIEVTAACFLAAVGALTFVSVILRYLFSWAIPDTYDISRLLLAILIFWGMAGTGYRGEHITVDLLWGAFGPRARRALDVFSNLVTLLAMAVFATMMWHKVFDTRADHLLTFDLHQPVWIYYLVAWLGLAAAVVLLALRVYRLALRPGSPEASKGPLGAE